MASTRIDQSAIFPNHGHIKLRAFSDANGTGWSPHPSTRQSRCAHHFIDEAGDPQLFNADGKVIIGQDGCSKFFMLGGAWILDQEMLEKDLEALRRDLLADPYLRRIPSMAKTAKAFHAKDDTPEVRREVYRLIMRHPVQFFAFVRDKVTALDYVRKKNAEDPTWRYTQNSMYDSMVTGIYRGQLHKDKSYEILISKRGRSDRTAALTAAVEHARRQFEERYAIRSAAPIVVKVAESTASAGLQVADYLLWALQRFYEKGEDRHLDYCWPHYRFVLDADAEAARAGDHYYSRKRKLDCQVLAARKCRRI